jgi:hypothetical protein
LLGQRLGRTGSRHTEDRNESSPNRFKVHDIGQKLEGSNAANGIKTSAEIQFPQVKSMPTSKLFSRFKSRLNVKSILVIRIKIDIRSHSLKSNRNQK